jgi:hypothetical protein
VTAASQVDSSVGVGKGAGPRLFPCQRNQKIGLPEPSLTSFDQLASISFTTVAGIGI